MADEQTGAAQTGSTDVAGSTGLPTAAGPVATGDGAQPQTVTDWLPEDLRGNESLKGYKDAGELAKAHLDLQGRMAPPKSAAEYPVVIPEGMETDPEFVKQAQAWALEAGMTAEQFGKFSGRYVEMQAMQLKALADADAKDLAALKGDWGDQYDGNLKLALAAAKRFGGEDFAKRLEANPMSGWAKTFLSVAQQISDDTVTEGSGKGTGGDTRPRSTSTGLPRIRFPSMGD